MAYADSRVLALDSGRELLLLDLNDEIFTLHIAGNIERNIELSNCLRPLVGKRFLLLLFLGESGRCLGGCGFCLHGVNTG